MLSHVFPAGRGELTSVGKRQVAEGLRAPVVAFTRPGKPWAGPFDPQGPTSFISDLALSLLLLWPLVLWSKGLRGNSWCSYVRKRGTQRPWAVTLATLGWGTCHAWLTPPLLTLLPAAGPMHRAPRTPVHLALAPLSTLGRIQGGYGPPSGSGWGLQHGGDNRHPSAQSSVPSLLPLICAPQPPSLFLCLLSLSLPPLSHLFLLLLF